MITMREVKIPLARGAVEVHVAIHRVQLAGAVTP
jgi:hypothetical protein